MISLAGFVVGFFYLEETSKVRLNAAGKRYHAVSAKKMDQEEEVVVNYDGGALEKQETFCDEEARLNSFTPSSDCVGCCSSNNDFVSRSIQGQDSETTIGSSIHDDNSVEECIEISENVNTHYLGIKVKTEDISPSSSFPLSRPSIISICGYTMISFFNIIFDETFALWMVSPLFQGGLGYGSNEIGMVLSMMGLGKKARRGGEEMCEGTIIRRLKKLYFFSSHPLVSTLDLPYNPRSPRFTFHLPLHTPNLHIPLPLLPHSLQRDCHGR